MPSARYRQLEANEATAEGTRGARGVHHVVRNLLRGHQDCRGVRQDQQRRGGSGDQPQRRQRGARPGRRDHGGAAVGARGARHRWRSLAFSRLQGDRRDVQDRPTSSGSSATCCWHRRCGLQDKWYADYKSGIAAIERRDAGAARARCPCSKSVLFNAAKLPMARCRGDGQGRRGQHVARRSRSQGSGERRTQLGQAASAQLDTMLDETTELLEPKLAREAEADFGTSTMVLIGLLIVRPPLPTGCDLDRARHHPRPQPRQAGGHGGPIGDLDQRVEIKSNDEIKEPGRYGQLMTDNIKASPPWPTRSPMATSAPSPRSSRIVTCSASR